MGMNNYGSSIIFGHPQGPTAGRLIMELIEELVIRGGGYGMFAGCARRRYRRSDDREGHGLSTFLEFFC